MATLTTNLFRGQGPGAHRLDVVEGSWPEDVEGSVVVVGPDKRAPGGHWFGAPGLLERIDLRPDRRGRIRVEHRLVDTPVQRLARRLPRLFPKVAFMEVSPLGVTNQANTNVSVIDGRMFVGYDAGRPVEVDPETLSFVTYVGANDEWLQGLPGAFEPLVAVAAHPAVDHDEHALWFVNYTQISPPDQAAEAHIARWGLDGPVERWRLTGMSPYDSIHDLGVTEHHLVVADLPFVFEPGTVRGAPRTTRNQTHTSLWIVAKDDLRSTPPGGEVAVREVRLPMPTGHIYVDHEEVDGCIRVVLQHIPLGDLMVSIGPDSTDHRGGAPIDPDYEGLISLAVQPSAIGIYHLDVATGRVVDAEVVVDEERLWGGILVATDTVHPDARARQRQMWCAAVGFDPDLVTEEWWSLYGDATDGLVAPADLPEAPIPGTLARVDLASGKVAEVFSYPAGAFPSPPTFVPRVGATDPDDGYVVVVVHQDGPKEVQVFDAQHVEAGPLARATAPTFNPGLLLHSCWAPDRRGPRPSSYRVPVGRDVRGALRGAPGVVARLLRDGRAMAAAARRAATDQGA